MPGGGGGGVGGGILLQNSTEGSIYLGIHYLASVEALHDIA